jgi:hypothetical protein
VPKLITKAKRTLNDLKSKRKYFNANELLQLLTNNHFSVPYYNSEVWHLGTLKNNIKNELLSASSKAIRFALHYLDPFISFSNLH